MTNTSSRSKSRRASSLEIGFRYACVVALLMLLAVFAPSRIVRADCTKPTDLPRSGANRPHNLTGLKLQLLYYECSQAYNRAFRTVIDNAVSYVAGRAKKGTMLALVLDIDETSLSNWEEMKVNDFGLIENGGCNLGGPDADGWPVPESPCGFNAWILAADAKPLDTVRLFKVARDHEVAVFFITGRKDDDKHGVRDATAINLRKAGYTDWADLMLEPPGYNSTVEKFKTEKRKEIAARGYTIIANVGDQYSDLKGGNSERVFKLPNPFYFVR
jgi:HAD superfamily, subfamily IIIB (Acid phosphatase)